MANGDETKRPYYGRDRREGRDRRISRSGDKRRAYTLLPPPSILEEYERIAPGSVDQLLDMADREQEHRHQWEMQYLQEYVRTHQRGQLFGMVIALSLIGVAFYLVMAGEAGSAAIIAIVGFCSLAFASLASAIDRKFQHKPRYYALKEEAKTPVAEEEKRRADD